MNFSRSSFLIEPFVLSIITDWKGREDELGDVAVFSQDMKSTNVRIMMAFHPIMVDGDLVGTVYVGKEISAV